METVGSVWMPTLGPKRRWAPLRGWRVTFPSKAVLLGQRRKMVTHDGWAAFGNTPSRSRNFMTTSWSAWCLRTS